MSYTKAEFVQKFEPYAKEVERATGGGIHWQTVLTQWAHESAYGNSNLAQRGNNLAGIKSNSRGRDYVTGAYSGYDSIDSFVDDYIRVLGLSYYDKVLESGDITDDIIELHKSPWATDPKYDDKMKRVYDSLKEFMNSDSLESSFDFSVDGLVDKFKGLSEPEKRKAMAIGVGALVLISLAK